MEKKADALSREERLAAKLRENLKRRKVQARELGEPGDPALSKAPPKSLLSRRTAKAVRKTALTG